MSRPSHNTLIRFAVTAALVLGLGIGLAGCGPKKAATPATPAPVAGLTARQAFPLAKATLTTTAPDAKLLLVAAGGAITPTTPPVWQFLFGSEKDKTTYVAIVRAGKATSMKYGSVALSAAEWAAVPSIDRWKIDSNDAIAKALAVYPEGKPTTAYILGFVSYIPKAEQNVRTPAMFWSVSFDPTSRTKSPTSTVNVNVETGAAALAK